MRLSIIRHADPDYTNNTITCAGQREAESMVPRLLASDITHAEFIGSSTEWNAHFDCRTRVIQGFLENAVERQLAFGWQPLGQW